MIVSLQEIALLRYWNVDLHSRLDCVARCSLADIGTNCSHTRISWGDRAMDPGQAPQLDRMDHDLSPEDLFIKMYRCAMAGLSFGDTGSWEFGRRLLARYFPSQDVGPLFGEFYAFARSAIAASQRPLTCQAVSSPGASAEEALALRMIEMSQRADPVRALSAATTLVGDDDLGAVFQSAQSLANSLAVYGLFVRILPDAAESPRAPAARGQPSNFGLERPSRRLPFGRVFSR